MMFRESYPAICVVDTNGWIGVTSIGRIGILSCCEQAIVLEQEKQLLDKNRIREDDLNIL